MFRNDRTNPSGKAGDWQGGRDLARGNPSTNVSDWMNGISKGKPPNAPRWFQCYFPGEASTQVAVQCLRPALDDGTTNDETVLGFNFYRDGALIHQSTGTNLAAASYIHTGLTTSQSYDFSIAAYSAAGVGTMTVTHAVIPPQAATVNVTGSYTGFWASTRPTWHNAGASGQTRSGNGYKVYQIHGSGTWYVTSNPDSAPITVLTIGGGGSAYSPHTPSGGAGGGATYVNFEQTNFPVSSTGDGLHTYTIAAGASYTGTNPSDGTCTNLHYNGSGWDDVTVGTGSSQGYYSWNAEYSSGGRGSYGNAPYTAHTGSGGSGSEDLNRTDGHSQTLTNMATPWVGGNGGLGGGYHSSTCNRGTSGGGGGGAGAVYIPGNSNYKPFEPTPSYPGSGAGMQEGTSHTAGQTLYPAGSYAGASGYGYETSGAGGGGGTGYHFSEDHGWGGMNNNNAGIGFLKGAGGGGGGSAIGYGGSWGSCYAGYAYPGYGYSYGGGSGTGLRHYGNIYAPNYIYYAAEYGSSTAQSASM